MISFSLSPDAPTLSKSVEFAAAMAAYEQNGGRITKGSCFTGTPIPPKRRDWVDPETVLKRKPPRISAAERKRLRQMTEAI
jgi:hypothetical protein